MKFAMNFAMNSTLTNASLARLCRARHALATVALALVRATLELQLQASLVGGMSDFLNVGWNNAIEKTIGGWFMIVLPCFTHMISHDL